MLASMLKNNQLHKSKLGSSLPGNTVGDAEFDMSKPFWRQASFNSSFKILWILDFCKFFGRGMELLRICIWMLFLVILWEGEQFPKGISMLFSVSAVGRIKNAGFKYYKGYLAFYVQKVV